MRYKQKFGGGQSLKPGSSGKPKTELEIRVNNIESAYQTDIENRKLKELEQYTTDWLGRYYIAQYYENARNYEVALDLYEELVSHISDEYANDYLFGEKAQRIRLYVKNLIPDLRYKAYREKRERLAQKVVLEHMTSDLQKAFFDRIYRYLNFRMPENYFLEVQSLVRKNPDFVLFLDRKKHTELAEYNLGKIYSDINNKKSIIHYINSGLATKDLIEIMKESPNDVIDELKLNDNEYCNFLLGLYYEWIQDYDTAANHFIKGINSVEQIERMRNQSDVARLYVLLFSIKENNRMSILDVLCKFKSRNQEDINKILDRCLNISIELKKQLCELVELCQQLDYKIVYHSSFRVIELLEVFRDRFKVKIDDQEKIFMENFIQTRDVIKEKIDSIHTLIK